MSWFIASAGPFDAPVRCPGKDLASPAAQRAGHALEFGHAADVEIDTEPVEPAAGDGGIVARHSRRQQPGGCRSP